MSHNNKNESIVVVDGDKNNDIIDLKIINNEENLEDLLKNLHKQIKTTNWLEENNVEKLEKENPELLKAWNDAINK